MPKLILAILIALSFMGAPATAGAAPTSSCTVGDSMNDDAHHSKMDCCTPACAVSCPPAVVPKGDIPAPADDVDSASLWVPANKTLPSVSTAGLDPPPNYLRACFHSARLPMQSEGRHRGEECGRTGG